MRQAHEAGLIDFIIMSDTGITGVDFQSTRQSLMVMVQPSRSPGLKDQFVGRMIRNTSHGLIPKKFQRVEHVTFFNACRRASNAYDLSSQIQPYPYFNQFNDLEKEAKAQEAGEAYNRLPPQKDDVNFIADYQDNFFDDEDSDDEDFKGDDTNKAKDGEEKRSKRNRGNRKNYNEDEADDEDWLLEGVEKPKKKQVTMDLDELLEESMLYENTPPSSPKKTTTLLEGRGRRKITKSRKFKENQETVELTEKQKKAEEEARKKYAEEMANRRALRADKARLAKAASAAGYKSKDDFEKLYRRAFFEEDEEGLQDWEKFGSLPNAIAAAKSVVAKDEADAGDDSAGSDTDDSSDDDDGGDDYKPDYDDAKETPQKQFEKKKKRKVGGKLDGLVDTHIDNHINVSAVLTIGNHAFTTVRQFVESDLHTVIDVVNDDTVNVIEVTKEDGTTTTKEEKSKFKVGVKKRFGLSCYHCHYENKLDADRCEMCGIELNRRYYKLMEYALVEQVYNTEIAKPIVPIYPASGINDAYSDRYRLPNGNFTQDAWTRDENMLWNYRTGFFSKLVERDQLRYMLSMVTVEHYMKQQYKEVAQYTYTHEETEGNIYIKTTTDAPYALENRQQKWYDILNLEKKSTSSTVEEKESSDIEFEYLSEYESDIESEYSD